ncbi:MULTISPECIES: glycosyltransferase family A protein [unclassified Pseudoalteromonas]|uniref:glycosyltransferase family A protein n=1 Tax=unclassified Pseudoalteromonas TaxID=194690 RepID=UPI00386F5430
MWQRVKNWLFSNRHLKQQLTFLHQQLLISQQRLLIQQSLTLNGKGCEATNVDCVVSLTSYGKRIETLHYTLYSLLNQTVKPKQIIVWLTHGEVLTLELKKLEKNISFKWCEDLRSYKKLIPSLRLQLNVPIITFDDDIIYPIDQIEQLYKQHLAYPNSIICHRAHKIIFSPAGHIAPYVQWQFDSDEQLPSHLLMPIGIGGVLYPVNCFDDEVTNTELFMALCPTADDIWFKFMALKCGFNTKLVTARLSYESYLHVENIEQDSLWQLNRVENDKQLKALFDHDANLLTLLPND